MIEVSQIRNTQSIVFKPLGRIGVGVGYTYTTCGWRELQKSALTVKARKQLSEAKKSTKQDNAYAAPYCTVVEI